MRIVDGVRNAPATLPLTTAFPDLSIREPVFIEVAKVYALALNEQSIERR
jgi:hypothetical protein